MCAHGEHIDTPLPPSVSCTMLGSWPNCSHGLTQPLALLRKPMDMRHAWTCAWCTLHVRGFFTLFSCPCCRRCHDRKLKVGSPPHAPTPPPSTLCPIVTIVSSTTARASMTHLRARVHVQADVWLRVGNARVRVLWSAFDTRDVSQPTATLSTSTSTSTQTQIRTPVPKNSYITCKSHYHLHHTIFLCGCCSQS
jgi:hypothetical protein